MQKERNDILQSDIQLLKQNINENSMLYIEIRRDFLLEETLREANKNKFHPSKFIKVALLK